jgi:hypothetical protein
MSEAFYQKLRAQPDLLTHTLWLDNVNTADAMAASRLAGVLGRSDIPYSLQGADSTTFSDLQKGPTILVSGANNQWTIRATKDLRFFINGEHAGNSGQLWISDRKNPTQRAWQVDFNMPYTALSQYYAIVGRFLDSTTGQLAVVAAGLGANGTTSAAECLGNSKCLKAILERDPSKGRAKNIEAVIGTQVIGGRSGPPVVLVVQSW